MLAFNDCGWLSISNEILLFDLPIYLNRDLDLFLGNTFDTQLRSFIPAAIYYYFLCEFIGANEVSLVTTATGFA